MAELADSIVEDEVKLEEPKIEDVITETADELEQLFADSYLTTEELFNSDQLAKQAANFAIARGVSPSAGWLWKLGGVEHPVEEVKLESGYTWIIGDYDTFDDDIFISPEGLKYTFDELTTIAQGDDTLSEDIAGLTGEGTTDEQQTSNIIAGFQYLFPDEDPYSQLEYYFGSEDEDVLNERVEEFYDVMKQAGRTKETESLIKSLWSDITDAQMAYIFGEDYLQIAIGESDKAFQDKLSSIASRYNLSQDVIDSYINAIKEYETAKTIITSASGSVKEIKAKKELKKIFGKDYKNSELYKELSAAFGDYWENYGKFEGASDFKRSLVAGIGDIISGVGGAAGWVGLDSVSEYFNEEAERLQNVAPLVEDVEWTWDNAFTGNFWRSVGLNVARTIPFSVALLPLGLVGVGVGVGIATALRIASPILRGVFGVAIGGSISGLAESTLEAGGVDNEAIAQGLTEDEASQAAATAFRNNAALLTLTNAAELYIGLKVANPTKTLNSVVKRGWVTVSKAGRVALTEAGQEVFQEVIQKNALGEEIDWTSDDMKMVALVGGIMGGGMGTALDMVSGIVNKTVNNLPERQREQFEEIKASLPEDMPEAEKNVKALEEIADDKTVQRILETVSALSKIDAYQEMVKPKNEAEQIAWDKTFDKQRQDVIDKSGIEFEPTMANKQKQLEIINKTNPAPNNTSTWVRNVSDIKTAEEVFASEDFVGTPDFTQEMANSALESGKIKIYSSFPIEDGVFVTPSKMEAQNYAGSGKVYAKIVNINNVAWIDDIQGQIAEIQPEDTPIQRPTDYVKYTAEDDAIIDRAKKFLEIRTESGRQLFGKKKGFYEENISEAQKKERAELESLGISFKTEPEEFGDGLYYDGMAVDVITKQPVEGITHKVILEVLSPAIYYKGKLVRRAEVVVGIPAKPSQSTMAKEPWQMTSEEFQNNLISKYQAQIDSLKDKTSKKALSDLDVAERLKADAYRNTSHKWQVQQALSEGKPVPQEVLKDYPDLMAKGTSVQGAMEQTAKEEIPQPGNTPIVYTDIAGSKSKALPSKIMEYGGVILGQRDITLGMGKVSDVYAFVNGEWRRLQGDTKLYKNNIKDLVDKAKSKFKDELVEQPHNGKGTSVQGTMAGIEAPAKQVKMFGESNTAVGMGGEKQPLLKAKPKTKQLPGQIEMSDAEAEQLEYEKRAYAEALQDYIESEPASKLTGLLKRTGWYKGELSNLTVKQYKDLTGKNYVQPNILTADGKHVRWEYALDDIATEYGYESGEDLKYAIEEMGEAKQKLQAGWGPGTPKWTELGDVMAMLPTGNLTAEQIDGICNIFGQLISSNDAKTRMDLTTELRKAERAKRAANYSARIQELIIEGKDAEEAESIARKEIMSGKLPSIDNDTIKEITGDLRKALFAKVYNVLRNDPHELMSTNEALTNALNGKPIPREPGTKGGSAYSRLMRVFGDNPEVMGMLEQEKPIDDIVEGVFREYGQDPIDLDQEMLDTLRDLPDKGRQLALFAGPTKGEVKAAVEGAYQIVKQRLDAQLEAKEITQGEYDVQLAAADEKYHGVDRVNNYEPELNKEINKKSIFSKKEQIMIVRALKATGNTTLFIGNLLRAMKASFDMSFGRQVAPFIISHFTDFTVAFVKNVRAFISEANAASEWQAHKVREGFTLHEQYGADALRKREFEPGTALYQKTEEFGSLDLNTLEGQLVNKVFPWINWSQRAFETGINEMIITMIEKFYRSQLKIQQKIASGEISLLKEKGRGKISKQAIGRLIRLDGSDTLYEIIEVGTEYTTIGDELGNRRQIKNNTVVTRIEEKEFDIHKNMRDYLEYLANASGRAEIKNKLGQAAAPAANAMFFSLRLNLGRLLSVKSLFSGNKYVRKEAWKDFGSFIGVISGVMLIGALAGLWEVETDPRSTDFMKIRIGNIRIDPWGGYQQFVVFFARIITNTGLVSTSEMEYDVNFLSALTTFLRSKASPLASTFLELKTGKDYFGDEIDLTDAEGWVERFAPFALWDIYEAWKDEGLKGGFIGLPALVGMNVQTYSGNWEDNFPKLGTPKFPDNEAYGIDEPLYDTGDFYSDTAPQFKGVDPESLTESKGYPAYIKSVAEAKQLVDEMAEWTSEEKEDYLTKNTDKNALLAIWGKSDLYSLEAYYKAVKLADDLDIPENGIDWELPSEEAFKKWFNYLDKMSVYDKDRTSSKLSLQFPLSSVTEDNIEMFYKKMEYALLRKTDGNADTNARKAYRRAHKDFDRYGIEQGWWLPMDSSSTPTLPTGITDFLK